MNATKQASQFGISVHQIKTSHWIFWIIIEKGLTLKLLAL